MSKQNTPTGLFSPSRFSFGKLLTPKTKQTIEFDSQPSQNGTPTVKKSGLEAYAKKNKLSLAPDFSDRVLECEMELEREEVSIEAITKLADLYTQAMAFYEAEGNHKHKYFAKKLQDLMLKPNVKETMVREIAPVKSVEDDKELRRMRLESQVSKVNTEKEAFALVKTHENKEKEIKKVLEKDLTTQRDRIQKKLAERKAKSQSRAQSVTYISDENSSTTEEAQNDAEKDIDASPKAQQKLIKIEEADEADENRYGTPPRRRSKDGQMIFYFPKGKKNLKKLFLEELAQKSPEMKKVARHARRYSENKPPVLNPVTPGSATTVAAKRTGRAQSFCTRNAVPTIVDKARKISSNSLDKEEESKTESHDKEARSLSGIGKDDVMEGHSVVEKKEDEKVKSNNTVEETDEEGSKNDGSSVSKNSVHEEEEQGKENSQEGEGKVEESAQVADNEEKVEAVEEKVVVLESVVLNNEEVAEKEVVVEVVEQEKEGEQVEKVEEVIAEVVEKIEEKVEGENVVEVVEVVKVEEIVKEEEVVEKVEVEEEVVENVVVQENKESEVVEQQEEKVEEEPVEENKETTVTETVEVQEGTGNEETVQEEKVEEKAEEAVEVQEEVVENVQEAAQEEKAEEVEEVKPVEEVNEVQVAEIAQEEKAEEIEEAKPVEEVNEVQAAENVEDEIIKQEDQENKEAEVVNANIEVEAVGEIAQVEAQQENQAESAENADEVQEEKEVKVEVEEEVKVDNENIPQSEEPVVEKSEENEAAKEEAAAAARRRRTDSEIADEEKLLMMRKIDEENKVLLEEFLSQQEKAREEASKQVEEKYTKKLQAMEEDMEPDEKLSMMWQKAVAKINKDKENEIQKVLEGLIQEHSQEAEKYKKKLQQQKMFKLAQLSS